jgi:hypothetical protein
LAGGYAGRRIGMEYELIDVTSKHRPRPSWRFTDSAGHAFRWHDSNGPAGGYDPTEAYHVPGTTLVADSDPSHSHLVCSQCGAAVDPGYTADWRRRQVRV